MSCSQCQGIHLCWRYPHQWLEMILQLTSKVSFDAIKDGKSSFAIHAGSRKDSNHLNQPRYQDISQCRYLTKWEYASDFSLIKHCMNCASFISFTRSYFSMRKSSNSSLTTLGGRRLRNWFSSTLNFLRNEVFSFHSTFSDKSKEYTFSKVIIASCFPLLWINDVQSIEEIFIRESLLKLNNNVVCKGCDTVPRSEVACGPTNCMSSPQQGKLSLTQPLSGTNLWLLWKVCRLCLNLLFSLFSSLPW